MIATQENERTIETFTKKTLPIPDELRVTDGTCQADGDCVFRIMSQKDGDKRVVWNKFSIPEINAANQLFKDLIAEGMVPYKVGVDGKATSEVMTEFDATAEEVIFLPIRAVVGG